MGTPLRLLLVGLIGLCAASPARERPGAGPEALFRQADSLGRLDGGALWGAPLLGPLLVIDPVAGVVYADRADSAGLLTECRGLWTGVAPSTVLTARTPYHFGGVWWGVLVAPLPAQPRERTAEALRQRTLLARGGTSPAPAPTEGRAERILFKLEWVALDRALAAPERRTMRHAVRAALTFRAARRAADSARAAWENRAEWQEGLAEYTAQRLMQPDAAARRRLLHQSMWRLWDAPSLSEHFALHSAPVYGWLLDEYAAGWRQRLPAAGDLGALLGEALGVEPAANPAAAWKRIRDAYDYPSIARYEHERARERQALRERFGGMVAGTATLALQLEEPRFDCDPYDRIPLDTLGTLYRRVRLYDRFGRLEALDGLLVAPDGRSALVEADEVAELGDTLVVSPFWRLRLDAAYRLRMIPGAAHPTYRIERR